MTQLKFDDKQAIMGQDNIRWMKPAMFIACFSVLWAALTAQITGFQNRIEILSTMSLSAGIVAFVGMCRFWIYIYRLSRAGPFSLLSQIRSDLKAGTMDFLPPLIGVVAICVFLSSMTYLKSMIVAVVPFWADQPLAAIDHALSINQEQIAVALHPALPVVGLFYAAWHTIHLGGILWVLLWRDPGRDRFIISFMLTWTIGMIFAYIFSSAGPIFTGQYDPSVAPESVRQIASFLWTNYKESGARLGGGISAFPSMHVALAAWFALVLRYRNVSWLGVAYVIGIFTASIILGWHYAADGIAGIALALLADRIADLWLTRRKNYTSPAVAAAAVPN